MQMTLKTLGLSALISFLFILPFMIMEVVNRRMFEEDFPFALFSVMWLNMFAISLILLPILQTRRKENRVMADPVPTKGNSVLANPRSAAIISVVLFLSPGLVFLLDYLGWVSMQTIFNGPNPEQTYLPGQVINFVLFWIPVAAVIIAANPIVNTLRAGGSLFAHPINLIIVALILATFAIGLAGLIIDQWPCFIGVPNCD